MFKGKAIYKPKGSALEYSEWACNFYVGCSNECTYCYLKKGRGAKVLGGNVPTLKKCFKNREHAIEIFGKELLKNIEDIRKHGLFFSFTTDPMILETIRLTIIAVGICLIHHVPVKILTKSNEWVDELLGEFIDRDTIWGLSRDKRELLSFGFTLTGHDELESRANKNSDRID
jgi:DNA repair photolyase